MGLSSSRALLSASSPHGYQSTGLSLCWSKYGLVSFASLLAMLSLPHRPEQGSSLWTPNVPQLNYSVGQLLTDELYSADLSHQAHRVGDGPGGGDSGSRLRLTYPRQRAFIPCGRHHV